MTTIVCVPGARHGGPWGTRLRTTTHRVRTPVLPGFGDHAPPAVFACRSRPRMAPP